MRYSSCTLREPRAARSSATRSGMSLAVWLLMAAPKTSVSRLSVSPSISTIASLELMPGACSAGQPFAARGRTQTPRAVVGSSLWSLLHDGNIERIDGSVPGDVSCSCLSATCATAFPARAPVSSSSFRTARTSFSSHATSPCCPIWPQHQTPAGGGGPSVAGMPPVPSTACPDCGSEQVHSRCRSLLPVRGDARCAPLRGHGSQAGECRRPYRQRRAVRSHHPFEPTPRRGVGYVPALR